MSPFSRTLGVGAVAALSLPLTVLGLGHSLGAETALALHAVAVTAAYLACLAPGAGNRVAVFAIVSLLGAGVWMVAGPPHTGSVLIGLAVAAVRSGWLFPRNTLRALALEAGVLVAASATAACLLPLFPSPLVGAAVATWGWFVAQSFFFLVGDPLPAARPSRGDAFERAAGELEKLLDHPL